LFFLIQSYLFSAGTNVTLDDNKIMDMMVESGSFRTSAKKAIDGLEIDGWTVLTKERPKIHALSDKFIKLMPQD
jgi:ABC-type antimicrobial peptide transport system ATPase subunit